MMGDVTKRSVNKPKETGVAAKESGRTVADWRPTIDGDKLRARRNLLGLSCAALGERLGKMPGYISDLENGRRLKNTPAWTVAQLAYVLGLGVEDLLTEPPAWATRYRRKVAAQADEVVKNPS